LASFNLAQNNVARFVSAQPVLSFVSLLVFTALILWALSVFEYYG